MSQGSSDVRFETNFLTLAFGAMVVLLGVGAVVGDWSPDPSGSGGPAPDAVSAAVAPDAGGADRHEQEPLESASRADAAMAAMLDERRRAADWRRVQEARAFRDDFAVRADAVDLARQRALRRQLDRMDSEIVDHRDRLDNVEAASEALVSMIAALGDRLEAVESRRSEGAPSDPGVGDLLDVLTAEVERLRARVDVLEGAPVLEPEAAP